MGKSLLLAVLVVTVANRASAEWSVIDAHWRPDRNPFRAKQVWDGWIWSEGWAAPEQFYPEYFEPAGSLEVYLRNHSDRKGEATLKSIDGVPIQSIITSPERAAEVIWFHIDPEEVEPGGWTKCTIRLRSSPEQHVRLVLNTGDESELEVAVPIDPVPARIESIAFSPHIDRIWVYLRSLHSRRLRTGKLFLDGEEIRGRARWTEGPPGSGVILVEAPLSPPWEPGSNHLVEVALQGKAKLVESARAWDGYFAIGLYGAFEPERVKDAVNHGINTYVTWQPEKILDEMGLNYVVTSGAGEGRVRTPRESGVLFYANTDEPDAHDFKLGRSLPLTKRLGVHAQSKVLPLLRQQRAQDPRTLNMVLVDNTFKPLNWYVYGRIADVLCTDPYVPFSGDQIGRVPHSLDVARDASTPRPLLAVLWATSLSGGKRRYGERPPSPKEERMMAFYALGCGVKGLAYFIDKSMTTGEGTFVGLSDIGPLWDEVGRINRDIQVLAPFLARGCPVGIPRSDKQVWARLLMCGRDQLVFIVVNESHYIGFNTSSLHAWHTPTENVEMTVPLPRHFQQCQIHEVKDGALRPVTVEIRRGRLRFRLQSVDTARAFLIRSVKE